MYPTKSSYIPILSQLYLNEYPYIDEQTVSQNVKKCTFSGFYQDMIPAIDSDTDFHRSIEIKSSQIYTNLYTNNHISYHIDTIPIPICSMYGIFSYIETP